MEDKLSAAGRQETWEALQFYPRNSPEGAAYGSGGNAVGPIRYQNVRQFLARFFLVARFELEQTRNWRDYCIGARSAIIDRRGMVGGHLPMLDYDGRHIKTTLRQDVELAQREFGLGEATVYRTRRGFHVYFLQDVLPMMSYLALLQRSNCCPGFRQSVERAQYGVLRVSSKYTEFDIYPAYVIADPQRRLRRNSPKATLIETLLRMGAQHQAHFASLFPQWAAYQEDVRPWKPRRRVPLHSRGKYIKKLPEIKEIPNDDPVLQDIKAKLQEMAQADLEPQVASPQKNQAQEYKLYYGTVTSNSGYFSSDATVHFSWPKIRVK